MASLQDQLLKSGLINKKKAKTITSGKRKTDRLNRKNHITVEDEVKKLAEQALKDEADRSRELNRLQKKRETKRQLLHKSIN